MVPFCKTGGLADVIGSLPAVLAAMGHEVHVMLPGYPVIDREMYGFRERCGRFQVPLGPVTKPVTVLSADWKGTFVHLVENGEYFDRPFLYGDEHGDYYDNGSRFVFFCRAVVEIVKCMGLAPDIISAHDWQTGLVPAYLRTLYAGEASFRNTRALFTIHNLGYQGNFAPWVFGLSGIPESEFHWRRMEFFGNVSLLKSGIVYADAVSTVSTAYAEEITGPEFGFGMEGVLAQRRHDLHGILNGIDDDDWNPSSDPVIPARFDAGNPAGKQACRAMLLEQAGFSLAETVPVFGIVSRLDPQKGFDILEGAMGRILALDAAIVMLGTGTRELTDVMEHFNRRYRERFRAVLSFEPAMARLIYAGADGFLMPSRYEPCGLGQMIAMRYGALPVVHATGGLADTVVDLDGDPGRGNGFSFGEYSADALAAAVSRAAGVFREPGRMRWNVAMERGMRADFSWRKSAERYLALFRDMLRKPVWQP